MPMRLLLFVLLCFCFCTNVSYAQIRRPNTQSSPASTQPLRDSIPHEIDLTPDTFDFTYFYPHNMDREYPYRDTTIEGFQNFDPTRQQQWDYGSTGNLGSAHIPFVYQARQRSGFDIGFHQFDLYKTPYEKFAYYRIKKAFTGLHFTQGKTQQDTYTQALFARNFSEGIQLSLDFKRINHRGHYQNQKAENTSFLIGLWYHSLGQNYHAFCTFVSNTVYQQENGGIDIANLNNTNTGSASTVPVRLSSNTANTAHTERAIHFHHRLLLQKRKKNKRVAPPPPPLHRDSIFPERDSLLTGDALHNAQVHSSDTLTIRSDSTSSSIPDDSLAANDTQDTPVKKKRNFALLHHAMFQVSKYKFSETTPDSSFYSYFQVDNRGLRYFIRDRKIENTFTLNTSKVIHQEDTDTKKQKDFFEVGIRHSLHFVRQEPLDTILQNLFLQGRWHYAISEHLQMENYADLGLANQAGDYQLHSLLFLDMKKAGELRVNFLHQSYSPSLIAYRHLLSHRLLWKNDFEKTFETSLSLRYSLPKIRLELIGQYHLIDHFIYFDTTGMPAQYNSPLNIGQFSLRKNFKLGAFHLDNFITVQEASKAFIRLPKIYSLHSVYFDGRIFKKVMKIRIGLDVRLHSPFTVYGYHSPTGQFYLAPKSSLEQADFYPVIDGFINFKVKTFRFFVKLENAYGFFTKDFNFQVKNYPQPYPYLRFGVSWQFLD